jgi:hypothetical protein
MDVKHVILQLHALHVMFLFSCKIIAVFLDVDQDFINPDLLVLDVQKDAHHAMVSSFAKFVVQEDYSIMDFAIVHALLEQFLMLQEINVSLAMLLA